MEKLITLAYMVENGYELPMSMDEMAARYTEEEIWAMMEEFMEKNS